MVVLEETAVAAALMLVVGQVYFLMAAPAYSRKQWLKEIIHMAPAAFQMPQVVQAG
jgi:hypothetical protein